MTTSATGTGELKVKQLADILHQLPGDATLTIRAVDDQRDGKSWSLTAQWDGIPRDYYARSVDS